MPSHAYINTIATAVPVHDVHSFFLRFASSQLAGDSRLREAFNRMAEKGGIEHRFSCFAPAADPDGASLDAAGMFRRGAFPSTAGRMQLFSAQAPALAQKPVERALLGEDRERITHLIVTTCTGYSAPGLDLDIVARCELPGSIERTIVGFMGCYAAITALKLARHIVRSQSEARVLIVNAELCTLHLKESANLEELLSFCLWGDGAAAALVSARPVGIGLDRFHAVAIPDTRALMTWDIGDHGFDMVLSGRVPGAIHHALGAAIGDILDGRCVADIDLWAIHPGGRSILGAVERALDLAPDALSHSRDVLRAYGNMSSATIMFVLERMLGGSNGNCSGCAMAFGPGLTAETMLFHTAGAA
ncbi:Naringenin-chalcone synthase [Methylocella silvestris BL2]|uniref:Naringenin-chalcone synthase n=1 Tax=Methylocella silvestris (strain DSM 15510 / CIP 108128 / LMG 27833 / NCIMB 13906 / BL2) TaxID=395965 RepID=B8ES78_METSB|nr:type III polyketide synthase [Methylocella silvestris]ACK52293.1 Naringenin-chalcone synthase [Methylocella silvestris BL2]